MAEPVPRRGAGRVYGVVLAAGSSSRLGRPKQLLPLGGRPLLAHTLAHARDSLLDGVYVVLGHEARAIERQVEPAALGARVVVNDRHGEGQSTSLHAGLAALPRDAAAAVFILGDQPLVGPDVLDALVATYRATGGPIVQPVYAGRRGNPVLFDRALWSELLTIEGDQGARGVLRAHADLVREAPVPDIPYPADVDTPADYERLRARFEDRRAPGP